MTGVGEDDPCPARNYAGARTYWSEDTARETARRRRAQPWASAHVDEGARGGATIDFSSGHQRELLLSREAEERKRKKEMKH
jgi:hypothetical protein